jgi:predicted transcriptional regulator
MPRLTIEFPEKVNKILEELAAKDETTKVDVLRRALALYEFVHKEAIEKELKLSITDDKDQILKDIVFH